MAEPKWQEKLNPVWSPGPHSITYGGGDQDDFFVIGDRDKNLICEFSAIARPNRILHSEMVANAQLFANADAMYQALREALPYIVASYGKTHFFVEQICLLLAKPRGELPPC